MFSSSYRQKDKIKILDHNDIKATKGVFELKNSSKVTSLFEMRVKVLTLEFVQLKSHVELFWKKKNIISKTIGWKKENEKVVGGISTNPKEDKSKIQ